MKQLIIVVICNEKQVNLLGEKVIDPLIHSCEKCSLPILIYGRMVCLSFFSVEARIISDCPDETNAKYLHFVVPFTSSSISAIVAVHKIFII